jgi:hypothetical protein
VRLRNLPAEDGARAASDVILTRGVLVANRGSRLSTVTERSFSYESTITQPVLPLSCGNGAHIPYCIHLPQNLGEGLEEVTRVSSSSP